MSRDIMLKAMRERIHKAKRKEWRVLPGEEWWVEGFVIEVKG